MCSVAVGGSVESSLNYMPDQKLKDAAKPSGPVVVGKLQISVDRDLCIGSGTCAAIAEKAFALDAESKSVILDSADTESVNAIVDAAKGCPVVAILIKDASGKKVFPEE